MLESRDRWLRDVIKGLGLILLFHLAASLSIAAIGFIFFKDWSRLTLYLHYRDKFHIWQLVYVLPLVWGLLYRRKLYTTTGVIIGAIIIVVLGQLYRIGI